MAKSDMTLHDAVDAIERFGSVDLTTTISELEWRARGCNGEGCRQFCAAAGVGSDLLRAAYLLKRVAGQINVLIHAVGILLLVPQLLEPGEHVEYVSLGAGNSGRRFDLETDRRVAEFKFIHWQGGAEVIRQNSLFKDFYLLAEHDTSKRKQVYVLGISHPLKFFRGGRSLDSVLSKSVKLTKDFKAKYGDRYATVSEYYAERGRNVQLVDAAPLVPELAALIAASSSDDEEASAHP